MLGLNLQLLLVFAIIGVSFGNSKHGVTGENIVKWLKSGV
jgi:hypothetical protein